LLVKFRKQAILNEEAFDFLTELVSSIPDVDPPKVERRGRPKRSKEGSDEATHNNSKPPKKKDNEGKLPNVV